MTTAESAPPRAAPAFDRPLVVDVDRHVQETWSIFQRYAEPQFREHVYRKVTLPDGSSRIALADRVMAFSGAMWDDPYANRMFDDDRFRPNRPLGEGLDPAGYLATMDAEGIDVALLTPTLALGNSTIPNGAIGSALCRAYGRWAGEFARAAPGRLKPVYPVNLYDVDLAVKDARWAVEAMGLPGFLIIPLPVGRRMLRDRALDPFWQLAQELDVPVQVHTLSSLPDAEGRGPLVDVVAGANRFGGSLFLHHLVSHRIEQQLALASLIVGGVLARFPGLRLVFVEAGGQWTQSWLEEMDCRYESPMMRRTAPWLKLPPSEYFRRQCLVAFHASEPLPESIGRTIAADHVVWSSDYPHHDCLFPGAGDAIRRETSAMPPAEQAKILGGNAARCYRLSSSQPGPPPFSPRGGGGLQSKA
ncbi:MAG TPA: amidohydrolase family protein [Polyangiaceae bacterium]|nr:amidohydrolase family protein [Polyangiaceae bacterium]